MHRFSTATYSKALNTCVANLVEMWISAHLHAYFALHNSKELQLEFVFYFLFTKAVTKYEGPKNVLQGVS